MYEKLTRVPEPGSPLESMMILVWRARQELRLQETRAIIHAVLAASPNASDSADKAMREAFKDYQEELFPFKRGDTKRSDLSAMKYLLNEVARGPLKVTPLVPLQRLRSRLKTMHEAHDVRGQRRR